MIVSGLLRRLAERARGWEEEEKEEEEAATKQLSS